MAEPSLGEITSIKPESSVNPGVILPDGADVVHNLNQSAQFNAEMAQKRYSQSLGMLKDIYQDIGQVQAMPILQEDRPIIQKKLGDILSEIGNDPRSALAGGKYPDIQKKLGEVTSLATQSKQDNIYDDFHSKYLQSDPELDTPENRAKIAQHNSQPLGNRQKYMLDTPPKFDAEKAMGNILKQKNVAVPYANSEFSADNKFINRETGTRYDRNNALQTWNQGYEIGTDDTGRPIKKWAEAQFEKIKNNPGELAKYGNPENPQEFYNKVGEMMFGSKDDIVGEKTSATVANPYEMASTKQRNALYMEGVKEGNKEKLAAVRKSLELQGAPENANFLVRQYADVLGNTTGEKHYTDTGNGKVTEEVINVPNNYLKNWANTQKETLKEGGTLDPVTQTIITGNMPDVTTRTKDGNIRYIYYKHYEKGDKIPKGSNVGDAVKSEDGTTILERQGIIPRRTMLATIGGPVVEKKILSSAIDQADSYLKGKGNEDIDKVNSEETTDTQGSKKPVPSTNSGKSYTVKGKKYTHTDLKGMGYTDDQINAAIKSGLIK